MKMEVQMRFTCPVCNRAEVKWVPARFHYSDGCYTVLTIGEPEECQYYHGEPGKHPPDCQGVCCGGLP